METDDHFIDVVKKIEQRYWVPDLCRPTSRCIFILESPHVQEVQHKVPVAGASGVSMTKHILGDSEQRIPLGLLVENPELAENATLLKVIGLMNVSPFPLQEKAYSNHTESTPLRHWFAAMESVRTQHQTSFFRDAQRIEIQSWFIAHLRDRLRMYRGVSITWIPCGRFAQKFFRLANVTDALWHVIDEVPHPSYNAWDRLMYRPQVQAVLNAITVNADSLTRG